jgi:hypothetical protein
MVLSSLMAGADRTAQIAISPAFATAIAPDGRFAPHSRYPWFHTKNRACVKLLDLVSPGARRRVTRAHPVIGSEGSHLP